MFEDETISIRPGEEFDVPKVEAYLRSQLPEIGAGTLVVRQFPSGASNLTYLLEIGAWEGVLRRPPFGPVPPKAHDMERESGLLVASCYSDISPICKYYFSVLREIDSV